jgi:hypothetical protein
MNEPDARHFAETFRHEKLRSLTSGILTRNFYQLGFLEIVIQAYQQPLCK